MLLVNGWYPLQCMTPPLALYPPNSNPILSGANMATQCSLAAIAAATTVGGKCSGFLSELCRIFLCWWVSCSVGASVIIVTSGQGLIHILK